ncbi:MAG: flagellin [Acidimicrobiia bacterium]|nr:flagellin [Acidimicrobiia bacterium]MDH5519206.1 flagellin [Acidimicrobiia bacterium]
MTGRITELGSVNRYIDWGSSARSRLADTERQIATGDRFERPSSAPTEAGSIIDSRNRLTRLKQFLRNQESAGQWLAAADGALQSTATAIARARTLALQALSDTTSQDGRNAVAAELRSVAGQVLSLSNTAVDGRPVFGGTTSGGQAYDAAGNYVGDTGVVRRRLNDDNTIDIGIAGTGVFGDRNPVDPYAGTPFQLLNQLADDLEAGDIVSARNSLDGIDVATERVLTELGRVGATANRVDELGELTQNEEVRFTGRLSKQSDTDIAEAVVRLRSVEVSYQATLSATARALNRSLLDFLR